MAKCLYCKKQYITHDEDAGTYKQYFCTKKCEKMFDMELDNQKAVVAGETDEVLSRFGIKKSS